MSVQAIEQAAEQIRRRPGRPKATSITPAPPNDHDSTEPVTGSNMSSTEDLTAPVIDSAEVLETAEKPVHVIHFVSDGLSGLGKLWYQGEELAVEEGSANWLETIDDGVSWITLNEDDQIEKWGERKFRTGVWSGKGYDAAQFDGSVVDPETKQPVGLTPEELLQLESLRRKQSLGQARSGALAVPARTTRTPAGNPRTRSVTIPHDK